MEEYVIVLFVLLSLSSNTMLSKGEDNSNIRLDEISVSIFIPIT